ncbi:DUF3048 domain-containing protein [Paludicola sp. MB14-C6]|uniref:DUF3048 domain-containing protein n=1 Tax=Paludihabitans sp. MB14-C6 TaxID=3070656 RepID=UPI0027DD3556|nr:DUF3048 domain-containing protein [Paludicola sp. MB14-C6]WMJ21987.1 DUF3048 domain-containing protein [Paludicola sp. MB14-C6]
MKKKILSMAIVLSLMVTIFTGCNGNNANKAANASEGTANSSNTNSEGIKDGPTNPFTGEIVQDKEASLNRPIAVMVNNIKVSLPQKGIADADIIYEMPVEGAITRLMAVFSDYNKLKDIGSIRSARHDYVELIAPYQPIYVHFGGSVAGKEAIKNNNVEDIDGLYMSGTAFYQDKERLKTKAREHTWFTNTQKLQKGIAQKGYQTKLKQPIQPLFQFAKPKANVMQENAEAVDTNKVTFPFSTTQNSSFTYNTETKQYEKGQFGEPHMDVGANKVASVTNVLMMYTDVGFVPGTINKEINLAKGAGYYISNGKRIEVTFSKKGINDNLKVFDKSGKELVINAGKIWVCVIPQELKQGISFQ